VGRKSGLTEEMVKKALKNLGGYASKNQLYYELRVLGYRGDKKTFLKFIKILVSSGKLCETRLGNRHYIHFHKYEAKIIPQNHRQYVKLLRKILDITTDSLANILEANRYSEWLRSIINNWCSSINDVLREAGYPVSPPSISDIEWKIELKQRRKKKRRRKI